MNIHLVYRKGLKNPSPHSVLVKHQPERLVPLYIDSQTQD